MKKVVRLTESDLVHLIKRIINEDNYYIDDEIKEIRQEISDLRNNDPKSTEIPILYSKLRRLLDIRRNLSNKKYWSKK